MPLKYRSIYTIIKIRPYIKYVHRILTKTIQTTFLLHVCILHHANEHVPGKIQNLNETIQPNSSVNILETANILCI